MITEVTYFPMDVATLAKGQVLSIPELEQYLGKFVDQTQWQLRLMCFVNKIRQQRERRELPVLTMRTRKGSLVICDDSDASWYNRHMGKRGIKRFSRACIRNVFVDVTKLTPEEAETHHRTIMRQAMMQVAIRSSQHRALIGPSDKPVERVTPKMVRGPIVK